METDRLILRQWQASDYPVFAEMNADPQVMEYFPTPLTSAESNALADRLKALIVERGWGFWAVELKATGQFMGFVGLHSQDGDSGIPHAPLVEIGWRLSSIYWGQGYATEAAFAALDYAFEQLAVGQVYAFTALQNMPSQRVMQKLSMVNCQQDFDHPKLPDGHPLQRHCLYSIDRTKWRMMKARNRE